MFSFNYIDRQNSAVGSSEKSQKIHSANWKEEVHLRKELESLKKQERETISRIFSDQRIVAHQFRRRLCRSMELIRTHERLKGELEQFKNDNFNASQKTQMATYSKRSDSARLQSSPSRRLDMFPENENHTQLTSSYLFRRPVIASEKRGREWDGTIKSMTSNLSQRAKSAPISKTTAYYVPGKDLYKPQYKTTAFNQTKRERFSISREQCNRNRILEVAKQREAVLKFIKETELSQL